MVEIVGALSACWTTAKGIEHILRRIDQTCEHSLALRHLANKALIFLETVNAGLVGQEASPYASTISGLESLFDRIRAVIADYGQQSRFRQTSLTTEMRRTIDDLNARLDFFERSYLVQSNTSTIVSLAALRQPLPTTSKAAHRSHAEDVRWENIGDPHEHDQDKKKDQKQRIVAWAQNVLVNRVSFSSDDTSSLPTSRWSISAQPDPDTESDFYCPPYPVELPLEFEDEYELTEETLSVLMEKQGSLAISLDDDDDMLSIYRYPSDSGSSFSSETEIGPSPYPICRGTPIRPLPLTPTTDPYGNNSQHQDGRSTPTQSSMALHNVVYVPRSSNDSAAINLRSSRSHESHQPHRPLSVQFESDQFPEVDVPRSFRPSTADSRHTKHGTEPHGPPYRHHFSQSVPRPSTADAHHAGLDTLVASPDRTLVSSLTPLSRAQTLPTNPGLANGPSWGQMITPPSSGSQYTRFGGRGLVCVKVKDNQSGSDLTLPIALHSSQYSRYGGRGLMFVKVKDPISGNSRETLKLHLPQIKLPGKGRRKLSERGIEGKPCKDSDTAVEW